MKAQKEVEKSEPHPGCRIFILGAGFSVPAGLPTAAELFPLVRKSIEDAHGKDTKFHAALREYINYRKRCDGIDIAEDAVDLEDLMSYLDVEHFLGLKGSDTLSEHGNAAQLFVKRFIGKVIHERTPAGDKLPVEYYEFANSLSVLDTVISFNYDVVLERALEHVGKPYRLFPNRFSEVHEGFNTVDDSKEEVTVLKMHGSLDWFSDKAFQHGVRAHKRLGSKGAPQDPIFNNDNRYAPYPLVDGPRNAGDPLLNIFRIGNLDLFYKQLDPPAIPMILSPSHMKIVYANPFMEFWYGFGAAGGLNLGISIIGFSLPAHDEYIRIGLYKMIRNYQNVEWDAVILDTRKTKVKIVDLRRDENSANELVKRYGFVDYEKAEVFTNGFSTDAVNFIFDIGKKA